MDQLEYSGQRVLVVGGTGMLWPAVLELATAGAQVLVVARGVSGIPASLASLPGKVVPIVANWTDPVGMVESILGATGGVRIPQAIVWIHSEFRVSVMTELKRALAPDAVVVGLTGSGGSARFRTWGPDADPLDGFDFREVVLGHVNDSGSPRWLTHLEISSGALRGLSVGEPRQIVGQLDS